MFSNWHKLLSRNISDIFFSPVAIALLSFSLFLALWFPLPLLFIYVLITVTFLTSLKSASIAPIILALFPRLWNETSESTGILMISIGLFLLLLYLSASGKCNRVGFWVGALFCFSLAIFSLLTFSNTAISTNPLTLFDGDWLEIDRLPWYYFPRWFSITMPIFLILTTVGGLSVALIHYRKLNSIRQKLILYTFLQLMMVGLAPLFIPSLSLVSSHTLLLIYTMTVFSAFGLLRLFGAIANPHLKILFCVFILIQFLPMMLDIASLYPYQGSYFNRTYGGLKIAYQKQKLQPSLREGIEWSIANLPPNSNLVLESSFSLDRLPPSIKDRVSTREPQNQNYYKIMVADSPNNRESTCSIVHSIARQRTPLILIKKCP
jgi:hypothetical protein